MGGVSGGTIASAIGLFQEPKEVRDKALHPYALDPSKVGKPLSEVRDKGLSMGMQYSKLAKTWTAPFLGAAVDEPVVRRSDALLGYGAYFCETASFCDIICVMPVVMTMHRISMQLRWLHFGISQSALQNKMMPSGSAKPA